MSSCSPTSLTRCQDGGVTSDASLLTNSTFWAVGQGASVFPWRTKLDLQTAGSAAAGGSAFATTAAGAFEARLQALPRGSPAGAALLFSIARSALRDLRLLQTD